MKKILIALFVILPLVGFAQSNTPLTPEQQLEKAQQQLEAAQKAVAEAKAKAEKAQKAAAEAKAKAKIEADKKAKEEAAKKAKEIAAKQAAIQEQIKKTQEEAAKLNAEAERLNKEAQQAGTSPTAEASNTKSVSLPSASKENSAKSNTPATYKESESNSTTTLSTSNRGWNPPPTATKKTKKYVKSSNKEDDDMSKYLAGAVPVLDGSVTFTLDMEVPGKSAGDIYQVVYEYMEELTEDDNQKTGEPIKSAIALVNESQHQIAARMCEWLVFNNSFISLDRSEFNYTLVASCTDNHLHMTMTRINYNYEENRDTGFRTKAEDWITDEFALNKNKNKLNRLSGKFRRATINRKDEIFNGIKEALR